jgi:hypothetical protein
VNVLDWARHAVARSRALPQRVEIRRIPMVDARYIRKLCERYPEMVTKGDVEGIVALYADDATIEDPIGHRFTAASTRSAFYRRRPVP